MKLYLVVALLLNITYLFGGGNTEYEKISFSLFYDKYLVSGTPLEINERESQTTKTYTYLEKGLVIIDYFYHNMDTNYDNIRTRRKLCYNEYFNEKIISQNKVNEFIEIMDIVTDTEQKRLNLKNYDFVIKENHSLSRMNDPYYTITIEEHFEIIAGSGYGSQDKTCINLGILTLDEETNRLKEIQLSSIEYPVLYNYTKRNDRVIVRTENFEYSYDDLGRMNNVCKYYNGDKILIKAYYYDGILRTFNKPYFNKSNFDDHHAPTLEDIIIYDGNILKYHIKLKMLDFHPAPRQATSVEMKDDQYYYIIFEYDSIGNEIKQTKYYGENIHYPKNNEYIVIISEIKSTDENGNWTETAVYTEGENDPGKVKYYSRKIIYK
jgi:hypothetical protein